MRRTKAKQNEARLAEQEIKFLQNPNALRKYACKALAKAKELEASKLASGAVWKREKGSRTARLTFN